MTDHDDLDLLREYAGHGSERAFRELVRRYVDLVYSSAARQVADPHAAEDVTQAVFIVLARKAGQIRPGSVLSAWLLGVTRYAAKDHLKRGRRRRHYEHAAAQERTADMVSAQRTTNDPPDAGGGGGGGGDPDPQARRDLAGVLDDALANLSASVRDAVVLRFFESQSFKQVGDRLGITEVAARQRVFRGLERLRAILNRRGVTLGAESLAVALAATAVLPAPGALGTAVAATATSAAAAAPYTTLVKGTVSLMKISAARPAVATALALLVLVVAVAAAGAGLKWPGRDRGGIAGVNPAPVRPIPVGNVRPSLQIPLIDIRPPENYTPPNYAPRNAGAPAPTAARQVPGPVPYAGPPIAGTIQSPDGKPLGGAEVMAFNLIVNPQLIGRPRGQPGVDYAMSAQTDGRFELKPRLKPLGLFVRAAEGYAWVAADAIKPDLAVTLSRWARLELTVKEGAAPLPQARVTIYPAGIGDIPGVFGNMMMLADPEGRTTLAQLLPGETRITWSPNEPPRVRPGAGAAWAEGELPRLPPREVRVQLEPGKTHKVTLGGVGRPVKGTIDADVLDAGYRRGAIRPTSPQQKPLDESARGGGGAIYFDAQPDGSFMVADVPPGEYEVAIDLGALVGKNIKFIETRAVARATFKVPPVEGGFSDQPLDIGKVPVTSKKVVEVGEPFPEVTGKTPKGEAISVSDFREQILLVQVGGPDAIRSRGEIDWLHTVHARFGHAPAFAMLTVTADPPDRPSPTFGDGVTSPWPVLRVDGGQLPEELEATSARLFLVDANGHLAFKNITAAQVYSVLDKALEGKPDPRVTFDHVERVPARMKPAYDKIPGPSADDAAAGARVSVVAGVPSWDTPRSSAGVLTDGRMPANEDDPAEALFFQAGSLSGRIRVDLTAVTDVAEIRTYSWHKDTRAAQVFRVFGSDGTDKTFDPAPGIGIDPATRGWTLIARVDTRPGMKPVGVQGMAGGGRYVSSIADKEKGTLGKYRHLLYEVFVTESDDVFGHTFYGEVDVIPRKE